MLVLLSLLLAACSPQSDTAGEPGPQPGASASPSASPASAEPSPSGSDGDLGEELTSGEVATMTFTECDAGRYTVGHPAEWNTNGTGGQLGPCEIFHPGDIEVPRQPRDIDLHYAAVLYVDDVNFDDVVAADNPNEMVEERRLTVDGRRAHVGEFQSTGEALTPEGEFSYTWMVDLDGQVLVAMTSSVGQTDYGRDKQVLDRMVLQELTIHDSQSRDNQTDGQTAGS